MDIFRFVATPVSHQAPATSKSSMPTKVTANSDNVLEDAVALQNLVQRIKQDAKAAKNGDAPLGETRDSRKRMREYQRARRAKMSADQKEEQRARQREYTRAYRARMSPARKEAMQAKRREAHRRAKAMREADEQLRMAKGGTQEHKPERLMVHHWTLPKALDQPSSQPSGQISQLTCSGQQRPQYKLSEQCMVMSTYGAVPLRMPGQQPSYYGRAGSS